MSERISHFERHDSIGAAHAWESRKKMAGNGIYSVTGHPANPIASTSRDQPLLPGYSGASGRGPSLSVAVFSRHFVGDGEQQEPVILLCFA